MAKKPSAPKQAAAEPALPRSLDGHTIPPERLAMIGPHMALLAATALAVGNTLPLQADAADYARVLEEEAR